MITIMNRHYEILCQLSFELEKGLIAYDDWFEQDLDTGIGTYEFTVDKTGNSEIEKIEVGCYVLVMDGSKERNFEIMRIEETNDSKIVYAEDAGLDLLGEQVPPYKADKSYPITHYIETFTYDSGWEIGINEIPENITRKLEWEGTDTATKRLRQLVGRYDAEIDYTTEWLNGKLHRRLINIYQKIGKDKNVRLEFGREISSIKRTVSIENLATTVFATGSDGITLEGIEYSEGSIQSSKDSAYVVDTEAVRRWRRSENVVAGGGIVKRYESEAKTPEALMQEAVRKLKQWNHPEITYDISISDLPEEVNIGDTVAIVDHEFEPALIIEARVSTIKKSLFTKEVGTVKITNVESKQDTISEKVRRLSTLVQERLFDFTSVPFIMSIDSTNGTIFQNSNVTTTLTPSVTKLDVDMSSRFTFKWKRVSTYDKTSDETWNKAHAQQKQLEITINDVDRQATFICEAYENQTLAATQSILIKDFVVNKSKGTTPPQHAETGDLWTDTSNNKEVIKIFSDGQWQPIMKQNDISKLQNEFQTNVRDVATQIIKLETTLQQKANSQALEDLTGRFTGTLEDAYKRVVEATAKIEGIGQRTTAVEFNLEQSQALINAMTTRLAISEDGATISNSESSLQMHFAHDKLEFLDGGKRVAYISNQQLVITSGVFLENLMVANHKFEKMGNKYTVISYVGGS